MNRKARFIMAKVKFREVFIFSLMLIACNLSIANALKESNYRTNNLKIPDGERETEVCIMVWVDGVQIETVYNFETNVGTFVGPDFSAGYCQEICFTNCGADDFGSPITASDLTTSNYFTIIDPNGNIIPQSDIIDNGACFSPNELAPGAYTLVFTQSDGTQYTLNMTITPDNVPVGSEFELVFSGDDIFCDINELINGLIYNNGQYYTEFEYYLNGVFEPDFIAHPEWISLSEGMNTLCIEATNPCVPVTQTSCVDFYVQPSISFSANVHDCNYVTFIPIIECGNLISDYLWDFGDGTFSNQQIPSDHYFAAAGTYTITLTVNTVGGNTYTYTQIVSVGALSSIVIDGPEDACCTTGVYSCQNCGTNPVWEFAVNSGQTAILTGNPVSFTWPDETGGTVSVNTIDANGCLQNSSYVVEACCMPVIPYSNATLVTGFCNQQVLSSQFFSSFSGLVVNQDIALESDLIVDADIQFKGCNIRVAPGRKIVVLPNVNLQIRETKVKALCEEMWDGIYADDATSSVFIGGSNPSLPSDDSEIWDAENGLVCKNGATFNISDAKFVNNYISLQVYDYAGIYPGSINNTVIQTNSSLLIAPHSGERMLYGVKIANVHEITIGADYINAVNEFSNMDYGIYATESNLNVFGNHFQGIMRPSTIASCPTCIDPVGIGVFVRSKFTPVTLTLGNNTLSTRNEFNRCYIGAKVYDNVAINAQRNNLKNIEEAGLYTHFTPNKSHIMARNEISFAFIGIHGLDISGCSFLIDGNVVFNNNNSCPGTCIGNAGILLENSFTTNITADIMNNIIERKRNGIWIRNLASPFGLPNNTIQIKDNTVNLGSLNNNVTGTYMGVRADDCRNILIRDNDVYKMGPDPSVNVYTEIRGIRILNSNGCSVIGNEIEKCGTGISAYGGCGGANLECNILTKNYYGFSFEGPFPLGRAFISDQSAGGVPTGNVWITLPGGSDIHGGLLIPHNWYYPNGGYLPSVSLLPNSLTNSNAPTPSLLKDRCTELSTLAVQEEEAAIQMLDMMYEIPEDSDAIEYDLGNRKYILQEIIDNPNRFSQENTTEDFLGFLETEHKTNLMKFILAEQYLADRNFVLSSGILSEIDPINDWEFNLKRVYEIVPYFLSDSLVPSENMFLELEEIAALNSLKGGPGVNAARVILQLDVADEEYNQLTNSLMTTTENVFVKIYPNPATKNFILSSEQSIESGTLKLIDVTGKTVKSVSVMNQDLIEVDLEGLTNGIYIMELHVCGEVLHREKLLKSE